MQDMREEITQDRQNIYFIEECEGIDKGNDRINIRELLTDNGEGTRWMQKIQTQGKQGKTQITSKRNLAAKI